MRLLASMFFGTINFFCNSVMLIGLFHFHHFKCHFSLSVLSQILELQKSTTPAFRHGGPHHFETWCQSEWTLSKSRPTTTTKRKIYKQAISHLVFGILVNQAHIVCRCECAHVCCVFIYLFLTVDFFFPLIILFISIVHAASCPEHLARYQKTFQVYDQKIMTTLHNLRTIWLRASKKCDFI